LAAATSCLWKRSCTTCVQPSQSPPGTAGRRDHLAGADLVYMRRGGQLPPLVQPYDGPYRVLERDPKFFRLDIGGRQTALSVDRLKPHTGTATPAAPPQRGRPPQAAATSSSPSTPEFSTPTARSPSPGLPATTSARPARPRRPPVRLDL